MWSVPNPLVGALLAGPDIADAGQQFVEMVADRIAPLEALIVQGESLDAYAPT